MNGTRIWIVKIHCRTILSTFWTYSSSTDNHKQFTCSFHIWHLDMILGRLVHMYAKFHTTLIVRKCAAKAKWETMCISSILFKLPTWSLVIGLVTLTLQHNDNLSWHALVKRHAIMFTKTRYNEHTRSHNSWIPLRGVVNLFKRCLRHTKKCSMRFKFRDCTSHRRSQNGYHANHPCTILLVCLGSLYC